MKKKSFWLVLFGMSLILALLGSAIGPMPFGATPVRAASVSDGCVQYHSVGWGETYWGIAQSFALSTAQLQAANKDMNGNVRPLMAGMTICIPASTAGVPYAPPSSSVSNNGSYGASGYSYIPQVPVVTPTPPSSFKEENGVRVWNFSGNQVAPGQVATPQAALAAGLVLTPLLGGTLPAWVVPALVAIVIIGGITYAVTRSAPSFSAVAGPISQSLDNVRDVGWKGGNITSGWLGQELFRCTPDGPSFSAWGHSFTTNKIACPPPGDTKGLKIVLEYLKMEAERLGFPFYFIEAIASWIYLL